MREFDIIQRYFTRESADQAVALGIGDDGAVLTPRHARQIVSVVDTMVEGVHFPQSMPADDIGFRAVAVNLSDIAAMGAEPRWMLLSLTLAQAEEAWLSLFSEGLFEAARRHSVTLVGGDTTRGSELVVGIHLLGEVEAGRAIARSGAASGDDIWLSGTTGDAAAGLRLDDVEGPDADVAYLRGRFRRPQPRLQLARELAGFVTAAIDVSDGLYGDLVKLLQASGAGATLELDAIPCSPALRRAFPDSALDLALAGGDDYELCFTAAPGQRGRIRQIASGAGTPVARIGSVTQGAGVICRQDGRQVPYDDAGYTHFGNP